MVDNEQLRYDVDIVMCIDATASMGPFLDLVKSQALTLHGDLKRVMETGDTPKYIDQLRVRVIAFRDYLADGENAMLTSSFFTLPEEAAEFEELVRSIQPIGGGDLPEDGLEALAYAIKSKWSPDTGKNKRRQIIAVWTDDGTHELGYGRKTPNYPAKMPATFAELTEWWGFPQTPGLMDENAKRLLIFAPAKEWWTVIPETWNNALMFESRAGRGLDDVTYEQILNLIKGTIS